MTLPGQSWLPLAAALIGLAGCAPPLSPAQLAAEKAQVQTGPSIIAMQLNTPPGPVAGISGAEASVIWKQHLAEIGKPLSGGQQGRGGAASGGGF